MNDIFNSAKNGVMVWVIFNFNVPVSFTYWHWLINEIYFILHYVELKLIISLKILLYYLSFYPVSFLIRYQYLIQKSLPHFRYEHIAPYLFDEAHWKHLPVFWKS